jgi:hypothetical protein
VLCKCLLTCRVHTNLRYVRLPSGSVCIAGCSNHNNLCVVGDQIILILKGLSFRLSCQSAHLHSREDAPSKAYVLSFAVAVVDGIHTRFFLGSVPLDITAHSDPHATLIFLFFLRTIFLFYLRRSTWPKS